MDTYRYCVLGPGGKVDVAREFECDSIEEALVVARRVLRSDPLWTGIELWQGGRRVHVEFSENTTAQRRSWRGSRFARR
jgi:hypothetical protein